VLSDIQMPDVDGFELLRQIRALGPDAGGNVPIIAMSAIFSRADRPHILAAGFQACVAKPFTADQLMQAILSVLGD
jgi:CheY-like chemotaxis protein